MDHGNNPTPKTNRRNPTTNNITTRKNKEEKQPNTINAQKNNQTQSPASRHIWTQIKGPTQLHKKIKLTPSQRRKLRNRLENPAQHDWTNSTKQKLQEHKTRKPQKKRKQPKVFHLLTIYRLPLPYAHKYQPVILSATKKGNRRPAIPSVQNRSRDSPSLYARALTDPLPYL
jgi:hypothetical protein